tara:strand:+ start:1315 stop:1638 length:324 start_codon:yes stop_codon:yes gene_type:complete
MSNTNLNSIKQFLEAMNSNNQLKFLRLILKNNIPHSENKNGTFINISELSPNQINIINTFIDLINKEEFSFNQVENTKLKLKKLIDTNNTINHTILHDEQSSNSYLS